MDFLLLKILLIIVMGIVPLVFGLLPIKVSISLFKWGIIKLPKIFLLRRSNKSYFFINI